MRALHYEPEFVEARDQRARQRFTERNAEMQRKSLAKRRGVEVPAALEAEWRLLKRKRLTNAEAAEALGLKPRPAIRTPA